MNIYTDKDIYAVMLPMVEQCIPNWEKGDEKTLREMVGSRRYNQLLQMAHGRKLGHLLKVAVEANAVPLARTAKGTAKTWRYIPCSHLS